MTATTYARTADEIVTAARNIKMNKLAAYAELPDTDPRADARSVEALAGLNIWKLSDTVVAASVPSGYADKAFFAAAALDGVNTVDEIFIFGHLDRVSPTTYVLAWG